MNKTQTRLFVFYGLGANASLKFDLPQTCFEGITVCVDKIAAAVLFSQAAYSF